MVEVESAPKAARGMESPRKRSRTARFPRLEGRNPIRAAAARKKRWMESKQLDLTFLGILG